ncbi:hypothetical protein ACFY05_08965 [Microtetraspora fusca]|uniref:Uncharacterized protein n=1 Tax=Microtetraspora fusca TaxID=1997 RepID=A0ABW6V4L1_MICFU
MNMLPAKTITVEIPAYRPDGGLARPWPADYSVCVSVEGDEVLIRADKAGLRALAVHLLALAEPDVPTYYHAHLDPGEIDEDSLPLVLDHNA